MALSLGTVRLTVVPIGAAYAMPDNTRFIMDQFKQLDREKKAFLARTRVGQEHFYLNPIFDVADRNADGRLTEEELKTFLSLIRAGAGMQVSFTLTSTGQGLFQTLDADGDGQLSIREMRNSWKGLSVFDSDADGTVSRTEFPQQFRLAVGTMPYYGFAVQPEGGVEGMAPRRMTARGPLWFRKMDTNGDGDVSGREWLGSKEDFDRIDTDKDGLLSADEAEAADAVARQNVN
jgi:Ca2+-binding EF-hand superfamily protein